MSCEKCTNIVFRHWNTLNADEAQRVTHPSTFHSRRGIDTRGYFVYLHHKTMGELQRSNEHCHLCRKLFVAFRQVANSRSAMSGRKDILEQYPRPLVYLLITVDIPGIQAIHLDHISVTAHCGSLAIRSGVRPQQGIGSVSYHEWSQCLTFTMFCLLIEAVTKFAISRSWLTIADPTLLHHLGAVNRFAISDQEFAAQNTSTMSLNNIALARFWYQHCLENHKLCSQLTQNSKLPHMILQIADPQRPTLVLGCGRIVKYATLSYKWGDGPRFLTTSKNFASLQGGVDSHVLPRTFAEAIALANELGFLYFWIDALCIRHDVLEELTEQISKMESIYAASSLTIFAAWGDSAHQGLAVQRDPWLIKPSETVLKLDYGYRQEESTTYFNKWHTAPYPKERMGVEEPLFNRGWVLQEQVLSLRGLIFNHDEMSWQCLTLRDQTRESLPSTTVSNPFTKYMVARFEPTYHGLIVRSPQLHTVDQVLAAWYPLIEDYSARTLTYTSDILPALAGLALPISRLYGLDYIAGLWRQDVEHGLLWWQAPSTIASCKYEHFRWATWKNRIQMDKQTELCSTSSDDTLDPDTVSSLEDTPWAPSWSWISRSGSGKVSFFGRLHDTAQDLVEPYPIEILDAAIVHFPAKSEPFGGEVKSGILTIKAHVQEAMIEMYRLPDNYDPSLPPQKTIRFGLVDATDLKLKLGAKYSNRLIGELHPDEWALPLYDGDHVYCIFCIPIWVERERKYCCLAVVPTNTPNQYRRMGLAMLSDESSRYKTKRPLVPLAGEKRVLELV